MQRLAATGERSTRDLQSGRTQSLSRALVMLAVLVSMLPSRVAAAGEGAGDPFGAWYANDGRAGMSDRPLESRAVVDRLASRHAGGRTSFRLVATLMPEGGDPFAVETRGRQRHAVQAAAAATEYRPVDGARTEFATVGQGPPVVIETWQRVGDCDGIEGPDVVCHLLLAWALETASAADPAGVLARLAEVAAAANPVKASPPAAYPTSTPWSGTAALFVLGPTRLQTMRQVLSMSPATSGSGRLVVFSPHWGDELADARRSSAESDLQVVFGTPRLRDQATALANELAARGVLSRGWIERRSRVAAWTARPAVALVMASDDERARRELAELKAPITDACMRVNRDRADVDASTPAGGVPAGTRLPCAIVRVDARPLASLQKSRAAEAAPGPARAAAPASAFSWLVGVPRVVSPGPATRDGEMDLLFDQLADPLARTTDEPVARVDIRAIGILGGSIADKDTIVRAAKRRFPKAVVFTTGIDVGQLRDTSVTAWRNVVVAAPFGLTLQPMIQASNPPFADDRQTSLYLAARMVLTRDLYASREDIGVAGDSYARWTSVPVAISARTAPAPRSAGDPAAGSVRGGTGSSVQAVVGQGVDWLRTVSGESPAPLIRLFEIGRSRFVDLRADYPHREIECGVGGATEGVDCNDLASRPNPHPFKPALAWSEFRLLAIALGIGVLGFIACRHAPRLIDPTHRDAQRLLGSRPSPAWRIRLGTALLLVGVVGLVGLAWLETEAGLGEPLDPSQGVSLWPVEGMRLAGVLLAMVFLMRSTSIVLPIARAARDEGLTARRAAGCAPAGTPPVAPARTAPGAATSVHTASATFGAYLDALHGPWHLVKPMLMAVAITSLGFLLQIALDEHLVSPQRSWLFGPLTTLDLGPVSLDQLLAWGFVFLAALLAAKVTTETRRCTVFLQDVVCRRLPWPDFRRRQAARRLGFPEAAAPALDDWLNFRLVAVVTTPLNRLIPLPFALFALAIVSHSTVFDAPRMSSGLMLASLLVLAYALWAAYELRRVANEARGRVLAAYEMRHMAALHDDPPAAGQLAELIARVRSHQEGAFQAYARQPALRAMAWLASGVGGTTVLEFASMLNL